MSLISTSINIPGVIGNVNLVIDQLSAFFVVIISIISFIGVLYSIGYIKPYLNKNNNVFSHYVFLGILIVSMLLVTVVQNALAFLIVWEIMSLSSFFLVIFENEKKDTLGAGINYLITMHISVMFLIAGFVILSLKSGSLDFASFKNVLGNDSALANLVFILLFIGFGIKAGFVPFHSWLPRAHPAAPSHISGLMSGLMIKTGIYGILRTLSFIPVPSLEISYFVLVISIITALFGALYAIAQNDLKKLLAYSSIENIGIIGMGIAIGMLGLAYNNNIVAILGFSGGILHILNHAIFKPLLFFAAGAVYSKTHTKNIRKLGGLIKSMPSTAALFLIGTIAIIGLPPLNGFISEFLIYIALLNGLSIQNSSLLIIFVITIACLALVGAMALLCFTKAFSIVFLGHPRSEKASEVNHDISRIMLIPMAILALLILIIGLFPQYVIQLAIMPVNLFVNSANIMIADSYTQLLSIISLGGFSFILLFAFIYILRTLMLQNKSVYKHNTWGCAYKAINNRMQYAASSFVDLFLSFLAPFFITKSEIETPEGLFPKKARFALYIDDIFEFYIINPVLSLNKRIIESFYWIQGGNTQQYLLYGLIFLIITLVFTIGAR
ncbi:MAG TPA: proton-conducting transporter membrane subunit [Candidatus Gastranaerophilales bacterium]|nr:proton-conducting transporter membrane subunit [Candidatus Gastranaerophilales bacterium]